LNAGDAVLEGDLGPGLPHHVSLTAIWELPFEKAADLKQHHGGQLHFRRVVLAYLYYQSGPLSRGNDSPG
jgi:hypothetical protein